MWQKLYSHNILLNQSLIQNKEVILFNFVKPEGGEEDADLKFEASRTWFMRFKEKSHGHNIKVQDEAANIDQKASPCYPLDLAKAINEGGNRFSMKMKKPSIGR